MGLTDSNGTLVVTYFYDPSGNLTSTTGNIAKGNIANPWRFASGYLDSSTGLYKFGARYYDPTIGRWTQQDPVAGQLSDPTSLNRYVYAGDDPVNLTDPSGESTDCIYLSAGLLRTIGWILVGVSTISAIVGAILSILGITLPIGLVFVLAGILIGVGFIAAFELAAEHPEGITICIRDYQKPNPYYYYRTK